MKKNIIKIVCGLIGWFIINILLYVVMDESDMAFNISTGITIIYFIILTIISYSKNLINYFKTGEFPNTSYLAILIIGLLASNKNLGSSLVMIGGARNAAKEFEKASNKLGIFVYTLLYVALWSFLTYLFYSCSFDPVGLDKISNILLITTFISTMLAVFIILIFGLISVSKSTKKTMKKRELEYQNLKKENPLSYDLKSFKKHYARPFYLLAYICFIEIAFLILGNDLIFDACFSFIVDLFGDVIGDSVTKILILLISVSFIYLPFIYPVVLYTLKMNCKRQVITFDPLKIKMITKDGRDGCGNYEKVEKNYIVNKIESFSVTTRYVIINGEIEYLKKDTYNSSTDNENKLVQQVKIPRIFSNEKILIDYLEQNKK